MQTSFFCALIVFTIFLGGLPAEDRPKVAVEVVSLPGGDSVGSRLIFRIKERIRESNSFRLAAEEEPLFQIIVNTMDLDAKNPGNATMYAVIWTLGPTKQNPTATYITNTIGVCGKGVIEDAADSILAQTDKLIDNLLKK